MLSEQKKKEIRAYLNARATWEIDNVPYINVVPKLKNSPDNLIWLTSNVEEFLFNLVYMFGDAKKDFTIPHTRSANSIKFTNMKYPSMLKKIKGKKASHV